MNIIDAIINLVSNPVLKLKEEYITSKNRANSVGEALEEYIKDLFAGSVNEKDLYKRELMLNDTFSYLGNQNNPPDSILKLGDAIEVKKIESPNSQLALNSSYPKCKIYSDSKMISSACRQCESEYIQNNNGLSTHDQGIWIEKDIIYCVGVVKNNELSSLAFVYGIDYAANNTIYEKIRDTIKYGIEGITDVEFQETNELGRVNRVDPLGITYLRIRGMWGIENPFKVFNYVYQRDFTKSFNFMCIINKDKWETFDNTKELVNLAKNSDNLSLKNVNIKDPNNPAKLKSAMLISYYI